METRVNLFLLEQYLRHHPELLKPVMLSVGPNDYMSIPIPFIMHLKSDSNCTVIRLHDTQRPIVLSKCLKEFEELLPKDGFLRIHRSTMINLFMVTHFFPDQRKVMLLDGETVFISPLHLPEFSEKYEFWFGRYHSIPEERKRAAAAETMAG